MSLILASGSTTRADLFRAAGLEFTSVVPRVDEAAISDALVADGASSRDIADALAEAKTRKVAGKHPTGLVVGSDQVLDLDGRVLGKPSTPEAARERLAELAGRDHALHSAVVAYDDGAPVWRHVGTVRLTMRPLSQTFIEQYVSEYWEVIRHSVGAYRIEAEGMRLFTRVDGDHFDVLGLPMLPLLSWLVTRGYLDT